ncbi:hypotheticalsprotein [Cercospora beticola]|uniref:Hypotheticalsprotein n=1 Tax=Cercospora beticola TaxID=122368 RepID=A0A2G5I9Y5_CERBT|nr:hypotheticalsprotein [Cercospora beticola]PIB01666.1 hypotheticalsprotein [Cercospora beticola]WPA96091.1 hypothetical protein RHO25_000697 [Cercospora beticola]CAK1355628.1 unnamed protein product [Cercospora beticola]
MVIPLTAVDIALPAVTTLRQCAEYSKTFEPFLPQLYALPNQLYAALGDIEALKHIYVSTNPAIFGLAVCIALSPIFLIASEINKNYSQVDRVWSILPTVFNFHYALWARLNGLSTKRVDHVLAFSVIWSIRLTYNYWRKGGYQIGSEDYRWELIKKQIGSFGFFMLNILFISSAQIVLLWSVTLPTYVLMLTSQLKPEMTSLDMTIARLLLALVILTYFADQQQWNYQNAKKEYQKTAKVPAGWTRAQMDRGFVTTGLWKYSRHPNFAAEQSLWVILYQWSCFQSDTMYNWTCCGAIAYLLVFQGSTPLTERISGGKYPEYSLYQKRVGKFLPKLGGNGWDEKEMETLGPKHAEQAKAKKQSKKT